MSERVEEITRPNVDGVAFRLIGKYAPPAKFVTLTDVADESAAQTLMATYKALVGTLVQLVDGAGRTYNNVAVLACREVAIEPVVIAVGGINEDPEFVLRVEWLLQTTEVT